MQKPVLRFNKNGKFRVLMISDIHAKANCSPKVTRGIEALLLTEADLIELPEYCHKKQLP